ncbi:Signal peptide peptidase-like 2A [Echinococcus granulosus]|uniref:Signal peptide peptidase-like 2A n=1 Tax=Echinococcus granulosus TaxID=6210 RepID=W6UP33_ECHGR|nr:Signal peptide peptidase-like 2A [Echinococcus granulosus]EUB62988.1 Signal peptide peptidase-like 2A [Echinococcus granulosus]
MTSVIIKSEISITSFAASVGICASTWWLEVIRLQRNLERLDCPAGLKTRPKCIFSRVVSSARSISGATGDLRLDLGSHQTTEDFSLLMLEDRTGVYKLSNVVNISVILAVTEKLAIEVVKPNLYLEDRVYFVPSDAFKNLLNKLNSESSSGLVLDFTEASPTGVGYGILAFVVLKILSLTSITIAGLIDLRNHEKLISLVHRMRPDKSVHPFLKIAIPTLLILSSVSVVLLAYFFYDIMVYFFIFVFIFAGASAMSSVTTTLLFMKVPALVGWIMQDIIGVFLVIQILSDISILLSFKAICIGFAVFVLYDVFFVFITPFLVRSLKMTEVGALGTKLAAPSGIFNTQEVLSRGRRNIAAPGDSIMEAVATGSAGSSGELMPLVFKVSITAITGRPGVCQGGLDHVLLGFGDAVLPGALCVFLAFYDACWKRRVPWNFLSSLLGYILGGVVVSLVLFITKMAQPALLYLCPFTLAVTVVSAYMRGGVVELHNLWTTNLPAPLHALNASGEQLGASNSVDGPLVLPSVVKIDGGRDCETYLLVTVGKGGGGVFYFSTEVSFFGASVLVNLDTRFGVPVRDSDVCRYGG